MHHNLLNPHTPHALFHGVLQSMNEGVFICNDSFTVIDCNRTARMTFNLPEDYQPFDIRTLFLRARDTAGKAIPEYDLPLLKAVEKKDAVNNISLVLELDTGLEAYIVLNTLPVYNPLGTLLYCILTFTDVTYEYANEVKVKKLIYALQNIPIAVMILHADFTIEYVNGFFLNHSGFRENELIGKNINVLPLDTSGSGLQPYLSSLGTDTVNQFEREVTYKNRVPCWEMLTVSSLKNAQNTVVHYVAVIEDITQQRVQLLELVHAKKRAEDSARLKANLLTNMSHELRTPINGILGNVQLLEFEEVSPVQKLFISSIHQSAKRLLNTLTAILELAEFDAAKTETRKEAVNPATLISEILQQFTKEAEEKNLHISLIVEDESFQINTDRQLLKRAIVYLTDNAIKFTGSGSVSITLNARINEEYPYCAIKISDTGVGIAPEYLDVVFEPFRQASEGFSRNFEGNGLGLTLALKSIQALGGTIRARSELNKGSIFTIILPID